MNNLVQAIQENDIERVKAILRGNPSSIIHCGVPGNFAFQQHPLFEAIFTGDTQMVAVIAAALKTFPVQLEEMLSDTDELDWTILHAAASCLDLTGFQMITYLLGDKVYVQAKMLNSKNMLPLELSLENPYGNAIHIRRQLENITIDINKKSAYMPVDVELLEDKYKYAHHRLKANLYYAALAASHARRKIMRSGTHPTSNDYDDRVVIDLDRNIHKLRNHYQNLNNSVHLSKDEHWFQELKNIVDVVKEEKEGNCYEYSCLTIYSLLCMGFQKRIDLYQLQDGDHIFCVIDRAERSDEHDFTTWGENAVVVDAWSGELFPAREIPQKLGGYKAYKCINNEYKNITFPFNKKIHCLNKIDFDFSMDFIARDHTNWQEFSPNEVKEINKMKAKYHQRVIRYHLRQSHFNFFKPYDSMRRSYSRPSYPTLACRVD